MERCTSVSRAYVKGGGLYQRTLVSLVILLCRANVRRFFLKISLDRRALAYWDVDSKARKVDRGKFVIYDGDSPANVPLQAEVTLNFRRKDVFGTQAVLMAEGWNVTPAELAQVWIERTGR
jgi:hypothetical protein